MSAPHDPDSDKMSPLQKHASLLYVLVIGMIVTVFALMFFVNWLGGGGHPFQ